MQDYEPNPTIVRKACELWLAMLQDPTFDSLGRSRPQDGRDDPHGSMAMAQALAYVNASKTELTEDMGKHFMASLGRLLSYRLEHKDNKLVASDNGQYQTFLSVDYGPDLILFQAGQEAGVPEARWPWKTSMSLRRNSLSLSCGYGAEWVNYYVFDGKWLVTTLSGSDIDKVFEYLRGGQPEFCVVE